MYEKQFAERLSVLRNQKNVSAREMSLSLGQNSSYINHIENGQTLPSMLSFFNICEYLGITPEKFFEFNNPYPSSYEDLLENLKKLNEGELSSLNNIVKSMAKK